MPWYQEAAIADRSAQWPKYKTVYVRVCVCVHRLTQRLPGQDLARRQQGVVPMSVEEDAESLLRTFAASIIQAHVKGYHQRRRFCRQVTAQHSPELLRGDHNHVRVGYRKSPSDASNDAGGITAITYDTLTKPHSRYRRPGATVVDASFTCSTGTLYVSGDHAALTNGKCCCSPECCKICLDLINCVHAVCKAGRAVRQWTF